MIGKLSKAGLLVLILSTLFAGAAFADEEIHLPQVRVIGEISGIRLEDNSFSLISRQGEELHFLVIDRTKFRSPDGSINELADLKVGMKALILGERHSDDLVALVVAAGERDDLPETFRIQGKVNGVDLQTSSFSVMIEMGESQRFKVGDRTRFRSRDGAVKSLADLEIGAPVIVAGLKSDDGLPLALLVIAGSPPDRPHRFEAAGEITALRPEENAFEMLTRSGKSLTIMVSERTEYRSRDGSIEDFTDLAPGMHAGVVGLVTGEGTHQALVVAAADPDSTTRPRIDVRAVGKIIAIGDRSFTIETRNQGSLIFLVDEGTVFKSRQDSVGGFEDLQVGMIAAVGGIRLDGGQLKAVIVGVGQPNQDRAPRSDESPADRQAEGALTDIR